MAKIPLDYEFGDSVIVVLRTTVQGMYTYDDHAEVVTDNGTFTSDDTNLIGVFPDPEED